MMPPPGAPNPMMQMMNPPPGPRLAEEGEWVNLPKETDADVVDTPDGGADITMSPGNHFPTADATRFYDNLVESLPQDYLDNIALELLQKIERDKEAREKRDEQYAEGLRRTGIGKDAPGGADFQGASKVVHPMLTKASVEFEARAMKEVFPARGPVKTFIPGTLTKRRLEKAERQAKYYNWLMTTQMPEFRPYLEQTLTQAALGGVQYMRHRWDARLRRTTSMTIHQDKLFLPYDAASLWAAERVVFEDDISELEYRNRVRDKIYVDIDLMPVSLRPDEGKSAEARAKSEGKEVWEPYNQDGIRRTYEVNTYFDDLEEKLTSGSQGPTDMSLPYLVFLDEATHRVLGIQRNWEHTDKTMQRLHWIVEWPFVPWVGAYPIGMVHMIGSLSGAATGALRALLDAGHIANQNTSYVLKGPNISGQSRNVMIAQQNYVQGGVGGDDIRKLLYPITPQQPSITLFQLLGFLVDSGEQMVRTTFENLSENNPNAPVGTTYALIEQGLAVVSTIIGRMHFAMFNTLQVLHRISRLYVTDAEIHDEAGELLAYREDFQGPCDVIPVSDPGIPSDAHRFAQMQVVAQRADMKPMVYNQRRVEKMVLERLRVPDPDSFLMPIAEPVEMNAANENTALCFARPIVAFPHQDHIAHLQTHIDFIMSPVLGMLPMIGSKVLQPLLNHLGEHVALWYLGRVYHTIDQNLVGDLDNYMTITDENVKRELDMTIAAASKRVMQDALAIQQGLQLPVVIRKAQQMIQQLTPPPQDPRMAAELQKEQIRQQGHDKDRMSREKVVQIQQQGRQQEKQADTQQEMGRQQSEGQRAQAKNISDLQQTWLEQQFQNARQEQADQTKEKINLEDNQTALSISAAEIAAGKHASLSTGRGTSREGRGASR